MRKLITTASGLALLACPVLAAENTAPLPPGNPAGVTQAQIDNHKLEYWIIGAGTIIAAVGAVWWINKKDASTSAATATSP